MNVQVVFASEHRAIDLLQGIGFERVGRIAVGERKRFPSAVGVEEGCVVEGICVC